MRLSCLATDDTTTHRPRWLLAAALAASAAAFQALPAAPRKSSPGSRAVCRNVRDRVRSAKARDLIPKLRAPRTALTMAGTNTLSRTIEEEERRIGLWKARFALSDDQVAALRESFQVCW